MQKGSLSRVRALVVGVLFVLVILLAVESAGLFGGRSEDGGLVPVVEGHAGADGGLVEANAERDLPQSSPQDVEPARRAVESVAAAGGRAVRTAVVTVRHHESGEVVRGADVLFVAAGAGGGRFDLEPRDVWADWLTVGTLVQTDAVGRVECVGVDEEFAVLSRHQGLFGVCRLRRLFGLAEKIEVTLTLHPDVNVTARVADANGAPAVGVEIFAYGSVDAVDRQWSLGVTDAEGVLRCSHLLYSFADFARRPDGVLDIRVGPARWIAGREPEALPAHGLDAAEFSFRLPPTGSVLVRVVSNSGDVLVEKTRLWRLNPATQARSWEEIEGLPVTTGSRGWLFRHVPVGVGVVVRDPTDFGRRVERIVPGPNVMGAQVVVDFDYSVVEFVATGRVTEPDGATPVADCVVWCRFGGALERSVLRGVTASDGRFEVRGQVGLPVAYSELRLTHPTRDSVREVFVSHSKPLIDAFEDFGDVAFESVPDGKPVVAAGRVLLDGESAGERTLHLQSCRCRDGQHAWDFEDATKSDPRNGEFVFEATKILDAKHLRVILEDDSCFSTPVEVLYGEKNAEVFVRRGGEVFALVRTPIGVPKEAFVGLCDGEVRPRHIEQAIEWVEGHQSLVTKLYWRSLSAGAHSFSISLRGIERSASTTTAVVIAGESTQIPASGEPLDLRDACRVCVISLRDAVARPIPTAFLYGGAVQPGVVPQIYSGSRALRGRGHILLDHQSTRVFVAASGYRPAFADVRQDRAEVVLQKDRTLAIRLIGVSEDALEQADFSASYRVVSYGMSSPDLEFLTKAADLLDLRDEEFVSNHEVLSPTFHVGMTIEVTIKAALESGEVRTLATRSVPILPGNLPIPIDFHL